MGLFKSIKKVAKKAVTKVAKPATKAVATGGLSLVAPKLVPKPLNSAINTIVNKQFPTTVKGAATTALAVYTGQPTALAGQTGGKMGLDIGGLLGNIGGILTKTNTTNNSTVSTLGALTSLAGSVVAKPAVKTSAVATKPAAIPVSSTKTQMISTGSGTMPMDVANAGLILLQRLGVKVVSGNAFPSVLKKSLASLASFARRTPTGSIISVLMGLGLAATSANTLVAWYATKKKYRRMNPANAKALRRAARRIKSFHRLCQHTDLIKTRSRSYRASRCGTCRKSPCRC